MKMVIGMQWKCGIHNKHNNLTFPTPHSHFHGSNVITAPSTFCFIKFPVSRCRNFSLSARSLSSNFIVGTRPRCVPSNTMPSGRSGVWSEIFVSSKFFGTLVFPFSEGTYAGSFVAEHNSWISCSTSSSSTVAIRAYKSSSSSSVSIMTAFPFSSMDSLLCHRFLEDMCIGPIAYLSFLGHNVRGDLGIFVTTLVPSGTSSTIKVCAASPAGTSSIPNPSSMVVIISRLYFVSHGLRGSIIARL